MFDFFSEFNLLKVSLDVFIGGTDTTSNVIRWALLLFMHYPHVQEKCFKELREVIGLNRSPSMSDKPNMPYFEATVAEILRYSNLVLFVPRLTSKDAELEGYVIPKGTIVMVNQYSTCIDKESFEDPDNFRPERFIGEDGKLARTDEALHFGVGKKIYTIIFYYPSH